MPKTADGKLDHNAIMIDEDMIQFVNANLFPCLGNFKQKTDNLKTLEYKIGEVFSNLRNKIQDGLRSKRYFRGL